MLYVEGHDLEDMIIAGEGNPETDFIPSPVKPQEVSGTIKRDRMTVMRISVGSSTDIKVPEF